MAQYISDVLARFQMGGDKFPALTQPPKIDDTLHTRLASGCREIPGSSEVTFQITCHPIRHGMHQVVGDFDIFHHRGQAGWIEQVCLLDTHIFPSTPSQSVWVAHQAGHLMPQSFKPGYEFPSNIATCTCHQDVHSINSISSGLSYPI